MSRELKFRVWNRLEKKWGVPGVVDINHSTEGFRLDPVNSDICQFTGLLDRNGKEIYEGDIVKSEGRTFSMDWVDGGQWLLQRSINIRGKQGTEAYWRNLEDWEVIGNIYENRELLK